MRNQKYLIVFVFLLAVGSVSAQSDFQRTDSISTSYLTLGKWHELIDFGNERIVNGDDFPDLRLRIGYAAFQLQQYSLALQHYEKVLKANPYQQTALYYAYWSHIYLNQPKEAAYLITRVDGKSIDGMYIKPTALAKIGAETAIKFTDNLDRGDANFTRIYTQLRANYRLHVDFALLFYNQPILLDRISQAGSYVKLSYMPIQNLSVIGVWNYLNTKLKFSSTASNHFLLGLKYVRPYYQMQADINLTRENSNNTDQSNFQIITYPFGNLNFYINNRVSYLNTVMNDGTALHNVIYNPTLGFKPLPQLWTEISGVFGKQYNYAEADGLYQYNGLDETKRRLAINAYYLLKKQLLLGLGYSLEMKKDNTLNFNYLQHSINAGITWNF